MERLQSTYDHGDLISCELLQETMNKEYYICLRVCHEYAYLC